MATDATEREREALRAVDNACPCRPEMVSGWEYDLEYACRKEWDCGCRRSGGPPDPTCGWPGHAAILAYGRAVREADKHAVRTHDYGDRSGSIGKEAAAAIKALENKQC